jgi:hypothetical protein
MVNDLENFRPFLSPAPTLPTLPHVSMQYTCVVRGKRNICNVDSEYKLMDVEAKINKPA